MIEGYLNTPAVRAALGIDAAFGNYSASSGAVAAAFDATLDEVFPTQHYLTALLARGVRVLLYVGANDWICNWVRACSRRGRARAHGRGHRWATSAWRWRWSGRGSASSRGGRWRRGPWAGTLPASRVAPGASRSPRSMGRGIW